MTRADESYLWCTDGRSVFVDINDVYPNVIELGCPPTERFCSPNGTMPFFSAFKLVEDAVESLPNCENGIQVKGQLRISRLQEEERINMKDLPDKFYRVETIDGGIRVNLDEQLPSRLGGKNCLHGYCALDTRTSFLGRTDLPVDVDYALNGNGGITVEGQLDIYPI
jgi:hypothetical protein